SLTWKKVHGGVLLQEEDNNAISLNDIKVVTRKLPKDTELVDLMFAWKVAKHVKSNAIVLVKDQSTIGIGAGQMSRVDSSRVAVRKLNDMINSLNLEKEFYKDFVIASDAFFPFADGISEVIEAGAAAIIQPGGSIRDNEVIQAADDAGISMGFTNIRHFKH
ncbi:bifunctional phosphoribosylaminoimidazolecarboxamide formyltransferase/IMP cyclohydrolase, partial [Paracoccaceae bacterium]|nr:bifunctional phosphoribosylaminoimidazolecarboxamide formyltransferase/IMP cyclohydrolase [Paracoccaceae bacterium]